MGGGNEGGKTESSGDVVIPPYSETISLFTPSVPVGNRPFRHFALLFWNHTWNMKIKQWQINSLLEK